MSIKCIFLKKETTRIFAFCKDLNLLKTVTIIITGIIIIDSLLIIKLKKNLKHLEYRRIKKIMDFQVNIMLL